MKRHTRELSLGAALGIAGAAFFISGPAMAADFYQGKTLQFIIGGSPGGGFDTYARTISRHIAKYIPGKPTVVPRNMPGAGSRKATAYMYTVAPKDGLAIAAIFPGAIMAPLLDERRKAKYDATKFIYLASAAKGTRVCVTWHESKTKTYEDAQKRETIMAASQRGGATRDFPAFQNKLTGTKFKLVSGYKGTRDMILAMERGEVEGLCGYYWSSLKTQKADWVREGKLNILVQMAMEPHPELTKMGIPEIWKYVKGEDDRKLIELLVSQQIFGRPYIAPPGVPVDRVTTLRAGFSAVFKDDDFLKDAARARLAISPTDGVAVQRLVGKLYETPKSIVKKAQEAIKIKK